MHPSTPPRQLHRPALGSGLLALVAIACTCNLAQSLAAQATAVPSPTPPAYPTYTPLPTYTARPGGPPPAGQAATQKPPPPKPAATSTEEPPPPGGGSWGMTTSADVAVTDLYPDNWPQGKLFVRITNNGPSTLANMPNNQLSCTVILHPYDGSPPLSTGGGGAPITLNSIPGQTEVFDIEFHVDGTMNWYDVTCSIQANFDDPNPSNNSYSEQFPGPP